MSLADYVARMKPGQDRIYYVIAESLGGGARAAPPSSACKARGLEVLLLAERIDEWVMGQLDDFEGKRFKDAARGDLELGGLAERGRQEAARRGAQGEQGPAEARQGRARASA